VIAARALAVLLLSAAALDAQALKQERRTYCRLLELRAVLLAELRRAPPDARAAVVDRLAQSGDPLQRVATAIATLRGIEPDRPWLQRAGVQTFALPEVLDPDVPLPGRDEPGLQLTAHTPYPLPGIAARIRFELVGPQRVEVGLDREVGAADLSGFGVTTFVPATRLGAGVWRATAIVDLGGEAPRERDLGSSVTFVQRRGFVALREQLVERCLALGDKLDARARAWTVGALAPIERVYQGEPPQGRSRITEQLGAAERVVANLVAGDAPTAGLSGWVAGGLAVGDAAVALLALRLPAGGVFAPGTPLILFMPGVPSWDGAASRPGGLECLDPWPLVDQLESGGFDPEQRFALAVLESPGRQPAPAKALAAAIRELREMYALGPVVLVAVREAGTVAGIALDESAPAPAGLVLVAGGGLGPAELARHARIPILAIPAARDTMSENLLRMPAARAGRVELLPPADRPWCCALGLELAAIERFAATCVRD
jgi:hypothetical protein